MDGYSFSTPTANTFGGTASVACATGYNGTATPASVECEDTGTWTTVSGCSIIGIIIHSASKAIFIYVQLLLFTYLSV